MFGFTARIWSLGLNLGFASADVLNMHMGRILGRSGGRKALGSRGWRFYDLSQLILRVTKKGPISRT